MISQRQGWPRFFTTLQQGLLGGIGPNGATAGMHGYSCTSAEKNEPGHGPSAVTGRENRPEAIAQATNTRLMHAALDFIFPAVSAKTLGEQEGDNG